jgi:hypothetical protein
MLNKSNLDPTQKTKVVHAADIKYTPNLEGLTFPFQGKNIGVTKDSLHFQSIDIDKTVHIPLPPHPGAFGVRRKFHTHEGVDLYCLEHQPVCAMESGIIVDILKFTGPHAGSPWWFDTFAVAVQGESGIINYGEINPSPEIKIGCHIEKQQLLGSVLTVLRKDKGRPRNMLHLELYEHGAKISQTWSADGPKPNGLLDPTPLLLKAAGLLQQGLIT